VFVLGAFTQAFGGEDLDASALMLAIAGFSPGDDPRMKPQSMPRLGGLLTSAGWCTDIGPRRPRQ
jgi:hypothetical protein